MNRQARASAVAVSTLALVLVLMQPNWLPGAGAQASAACKRASAAPGSVSAGKAERVMLCLLNNRRSNRGVPGLSRQGELDAAAHRHSTLMVKDRCFAHTCPGEPGLFDRLRGAGYLSGLGGLLGWGIGENIAWGSGPVGSPKAIVRAWMNSDGHRRNILDRDFDQIGVGVVWGSPAGGGRGAGTYTTDFGYRNG